MRIVNKLLLTVVFCIPAAAASIAASPSGTASSGEKVITFRFVPGNDMFFIPWGGNDAQLNALYALVDDYRAEITSGVVPVYVDGYCSLEKAPEESFRIAVTRSNRVKSELITNKGLSEDNFITKNHTTFYTAPDGQSYRDMVVVTLRIPHRGEPDTARAERERREREAAEQARLEREKAAEQAQLERDRAEREQQAQAERDRAASEQAAKERAAAQQAERERLAALKAANAKPYSVAVRTNLLYDAFLLPTLGVEWRVNRHLGIKLDGSFSYWDKEAGKVQKIWLVSPEVRWYMGGNKRFYVGTSGNFGAYNTYGYLLGGFYPETTANGGYQGKTGYQGKLWNAGLTAGYQLRLSSAISLDFNLGFGYTTLEYDSFYIMDNKRLYWEKARSKSFWSPTQAGISLVWTINSNK